MPTDEERRRCFEGRRCCTRPRTTRNARAFASARSAAIMGKRVAPVVLRGVTMTHERLERFRRQLLDVRLTLLRRRRQALADEQGLMAEREVDWTDAAANDTAVTVLESLSETERQALRRIDRSLQR